MANDSGGDYAFGRLILDYLKAFLWPVVVIAIVLVYRDDVRQILTEREVDILGVRIGDRIAGIQAQARAEIDDIRILLEAQAEALSVEGGSELVESIDTKLASFERNLSQAIADVQMEQRAMQVASTAQRAREPVATAPSRGELAGAAERRGFEALLARDAAAALAAFDEARRIWPEYHNVTEIGRAIRRYGDSLADPRSPAWQQLYREILTQYSWGMPEDLRPRLRAAATAD